MFIYISIYRFKMKVFILVSLMVVAVLSDAINVTDEDLQEWEAFKVILKTLQHFL